jgi:hypothetical protein
MAAGVGQLMASVVWLTFSAMLAEEDESNYGL